MATATYTASTLKTCRNGSSWRSDYPYAGIGQGYTYDSAQRIGYLGFSFNLSGKSITKITFSFTFDTTGLGAWATKYMDFYQYVSSSSPPSTVGTKIGGFSGTGMYDTTTTYTFDSSTNASCFEGLKSYFESGGSELIIKAPTDDKKTHSHGDYSDSYALISKAVVTIEYSNTYKITYDTTTNGGSGTIRETTLVESVEGTTTTDLPTAPPKATSNYKTVTYDGNGGTPSKNSDTNTVTYTYGFASWNTKANGTGTSYGSGAKITITAALKLYAIYEVIKTEYSEVTAATVSRPATTDTRTVTFNFNGNGTSNQSKTSSSTTTYNCTGWYTAKEGGSKRVNAGAKFTPSANETLCAQYSQSSTAYPAITLPNTPTRPGYTFSGWFDSEGIGYPGSFTPESSMTLTAAWTPIKYPVTIWSLFSDEPVLRLELDYDSTYTLPSFGAQTYQDYSGYAAELRFYDETSDFDSTSSVDLFRYARFNDEYEVEMYGTYERFRPGAVFTIYDALDIYMCWEYEDTTYVTHTMPQATMEIPFGKRFQGWTDQDTGITYQPGMAYTFECEPERTKALAATWLDVTSSYGKNLYLKVNGTMKQGTAYVKVNNTYTPAVAVFVKVDGRWKTKES